MAVFLAKINAERHGPSGTPRPTRAVEWEGKEVDAPRPRSLSGSPASPPSAGDKVFIWTHEGADWGGGLGLTASAKIAQVRPNSEGLHLRLEAVELLRPHFHVGDIPEGRSGSRVIEAIRGYALRQLIQLDVEEAFEFMSAVANLLQDRATRLAEARHVHLSTTARALEADAQEVERSFERRFRHQETRPAQAEFRRKLIETYGGCCVVTGCRVVEALEACHIVGFAQDVALREEPRNGLLLRADVHRLFDTGRLAIHPIQRRVMLAPHAASSSYRRLCERTIAHEADPELLGRHFREFQKLWAAV